MTLKQRIQWWRTLARDYENRDSRVQYPGGGAWYICEFSGWDGTKDDMAPLSDGEASSAYWPCWFPTKGPDAFDLRALTCCLIATLLEAGENPKDYQ